MPADLRADPATATFRITGSALDDLINVSEAMGLVERRRVSLEEALREALLMAAATLQATVLDQFDALLIGMQAQHQQPRNDPPELAAA